MAVPLFLLIQVFHCYKNGLNEIKHIRWKKVLLNLVCPYLIAEGLIISIMSFTEQIPLTLCFTSCLKNWGFGPGEYYIWEYFQFLLLCPIVGLLYKKLTVRMACCISIAISIALELLINFVPITEHAYKYLFFRYYFLIYLGYQWSLNNVVLNRKIILLSCISIISIIVFDYTDINLSPFFYDSSWKCFHWISYFYTASVLIFMIHFVHRRISIYLQRIIEQFGQDSWSIFCVQIVVYCFLSPDSFSFINSITLRGAIYFFCGIIFSIVPVMIVKKLSLKVCKK